MSWDATPCVRDAVNVRDPAGHSVHSGPIWVTVRPAGVPLPEEGWKLHLSSRAASFGNLVRTVLPYLLDAGCHFKLALSDTELARLNQGMDMPASVGKAMTVYPDVSQVREIGLTLARMLRGHTGPRVLSDRRVSDDAPVYYRYGPFAARWYPGHRGSLAIGLRGPDGEVFDGVATLEYRQPDWVTDPFGSGANGDALLLGGRYRVSEGVHQAAGGNVYRAVDVRTGETVMVKQARAYTGESREGYDARGRLRNERRILAACAGIPRIPAFLDHFAHGPDEFLVTSDVGTTNLLTRVRIRGGYLAPGTDDASGFADLAAALATTVLALHERGVQMRDITPRNIVLSSDGPSLVDFGIAAADGFHITGGTPGFAAPRQMRHEEPDPTDDCYSLGMTLAFAATGMLPLVGIADVALARRRVLQALAGIYRGTRPGFVSLIAGLLSERREPSRNALRAAATGTWDQGTRARRRVTARAVDAGTLARLESQVLDTLLDQLATHQLDQPASSYASVDASIYTGSAGVGLELMHHRDRPGVPDSLARLAIHADAASRRVGAIPGLLVGSTGVAYFLATMRVAGLPVPDLPLSTPDDADDDGTHPSDGDDVFAGTAGTGLGWLYLHDIEGGHLNAALACAQPLLDRAEMTMSVPTETGLPEGSAVEPATGYAHGLAGVVDFLVALSARTADPRVHDAARRGADRLLNRALRLVDLAGGSSAVPICASWCQGFAGIGRTLMHASDRLGDDRLARTALAAADASVAWVPRMENLGQCCGLAGIGCYLIDCARWSGDERYLLAAHAAARHLLVRSSGPDEAPVFIHPQRQDNPLSWAMGNTGILTFLRRLSRPETPDILPLLTQPRRLSATSATPGGTAPTPA